MALIRKRRPWDRQPQGAVETKDPQWRLVNGGQVVDSGAGPSTSVAVTAAVSVRGRTRQKASANSSGYETYPIAPLTIGTGDFSMVLDWEQFGGTESNSYIYVLGLGAGAMALASIHASSGVNIGFYDGSGILDTGIPKITLAGFYRAALTRRNGVLYANVNGVTGSVAMTRSIAAASSLTVNSYAPAGGAGCFFGVNYTLAGIKPGAMSDAELQGFTDNPWQLFAPQSIWVPVSAGGGTPTLTVPDTSHAHTLDNVVLTSSTALVVQDMAHGHALDAATLSTTGATSLAVADLAHAHALDAVALTSQTDLAAADIAHGHATDNLALTLDTFLAAQDASHSHAADSLSLTLDTTLAIADALHAHNADNLTITPSGTATDLELILKILRNRQELNAATGTFTLYDDDSTTVLYTANAWADAAGTTPYSGGTLARIDALA